MTRRIVAAALLLPSLTGCGALVAAGSATGAAGGTLALIDRLSGVADTVIADGCQAYSGARGAANDAIGKGVVDTATAAKIAAIERFGDAACARTPPGDPLQTAIWLGRLVGQIATLSSADRPGG